MAGPRAVDAEVVRRVHEARAEVVLPDAVDHHARGQRIVGIGEPRARSVRGFARVGGQFRDLRRRSRCRAAAGRPRAPSCPCSPRFRTWIGVRSAATLRTVLRAGSGGGKLSSSSFSFDSACSRASPVSPVHRLLKLLDLGLDRVGLRLPRGLFGGARPDDVVFVRRGEERLQAVVVVLRDRVELVVVAAGAADRQAEERRRRSRRSSRSALRCG